MPPVTRSRRALASAPTPASAPSASTGGNPKASRSKAAQPRINEHGSVKRSVRRARHNATAAADGSKSAESAASWQTAATNAAGGADTSARDTESKAYAVPSASPTAAAAARDAATDAHGTGHPDDTNAGASLPAQRAFASPVRTSAPSSQLSAATPSPKRAPSGAGRNGASMTSAARAHPRKRATDSHPLSSPPSPPRRRVSLVSQEADEHVSDETVPREERGGEAAGGHASTEALRQFDLDVRYGPCVGVTRMERWQRAAHLGLDPPDAVRRVLERAAATDARGCDVDGQSRALAGALLDPIFAFPQRSI